MGRYRKQAKNVNRHTDQGTRLLDESVKRDGWIGAITTAADGETFDGSNRIEIGKAAFENAIEVHTDGSQPVVVVRDDIPTADDPKAKRLGIVANAVTSLDWNPDAALLKAIAEDDPAIRALAQEDAKLRELLKGEAKGEKFDPSELIDKAAELQEKWQVKRGEIWTAGRHRLMCGDSTSKEDVARLMDGKRAQLVVTSPPYPGAEMWQTEGEKLIAVGNAVLEMLPSVLDAGGVLCWNTSDIATGNSGMVPNVARDTVKAIQLGLIKRGEMIWEKGVSYLTPPPFTRRPVIPNSLTESILMFVNGKWQPRDKSGVLNDEQMLWQRENVWKMHTESAKKIGHKAPFPVELASRCVQLWSLEGDTVFDPFVGSGSTVVACEQNERTGFGMEIDPCACAVALERISLLGLTCERVLSR